MTLKQNIIPINDIKEISDILFNVLGPGYIHLLSEEFAGESILTANIIVCEKHLSEMPFSDFVYLYRIIHFYYPRWVAAKAIEHSSDKYAEYSSNNELLLALTSIVDWLGNKNRDTYNSKAIGWKKQFQNFLTHNLNHKEIRALVSNAYVFRKGKKVRLKNITEFAEYIYEVRSIIVHYAELTGIYPYNVSFDFESNSNLHIMLRPEIFRKYLWKAIFNKLNLKKLIS